MKKKFVLRSSPISVLVSYPEPDSAHNLQVLLGDKQLLNLTAGPRVQNSTINDVGPSRARVRVEQYPAGAKILFEMEVCEGAGQFARLECRDDNVNPVSASYGFREEPLDETVPQEAHVAGGST